MVDEGKEASSSHASTKDSASLTPALPSSSSRSELLTKEESNLILNTAQQMQLDANISNDDQSFVGMAKAITCCGTTDTTLRMVPSGARKSETEIKTQPRGVHAVMSVSEQSDSQAPLLKKEREAPVKPHEYKKQSSLDDWSDKMGEKMEGMGSLMEGMNKVSNRFKNAGGLFAGFSKSMSEEPKEKAPIKVIAPKKSPEVDSKIEQKVSSLPPPPKVSPSSSLQGQSKVLEVGKAAPDAQKPPSQPIDEKVPPRPPPRSPMTCHLSLDSSSTATTQKLLKHSESLGSSSLSPTSPPTVPPPPLKLSPMSSKPPPTTPPTSPRRASQ